MPWGYYTPTMTEQDYTTRDQEGNEIEVKVDAINGMRVLYLEFPIPTKPLNFLEFMEVRGKVSREIIEYIKTHKAPTDPFEAAESLANKMKEVLTKHYKSMGVL